MEKDIAITVSGIKEIEEKKLVGFRVVCKDMAEYGQEIPKAFMTLERRKDELKNLVNPVKIIGAFKAAETSEEEDGYWVCYEVHNFVGIPEGMVSLTIPGQEYAVLHFEGHPSEIFQGYTHLHKWIEENGYKRLPNMWTLEIYSTEDKVDLCNPIY